MLTISMMDGPEAALACYGDPSAPKPQGVIYASQPLLAEEAAKLKQEWFQAMKGR